MSKRTHAMLAKRAVLRVLWLLGVFHFMAKSRWRNERLLILCYHGISIEEEHEWRPSSFMAAPLFESRLEMLRAKGYTVLPLEDALNKLYSKTLPPKSVVITFDDGLYNFHLRACPLMKKFDVPSTLYLTTYYCDHPFSVFPLMCAYMFWLNRDRVMPANPFLGFDQPLDLTEFSSRRKAESDLAAFVKQHHLKAEQQEDLLKLLAVHLGLDFEQLTATRRFHLMTPEEVKDASENGIDIQLHTHRHRTPKDQPLFQKEITENHNKIMQYTGKKPSHFCYPSGVYRLYNLPWLKELAVTSATTCDHALADANSNPLLLPRFLDSSNVSEIEFESWLTGVGPFLRNYIHGR